MYLQKSVGHLFWGLSLLAVVGCGESNTVSSKVDVTITPKAPVVILADMTLNPGTSTEKVIKGPWYGVTFSVNNKSAKDITIQALSFETTAITTSGSRSVKTVSTDAGDFPNDTFLIEVPAGTSSDFSSVAGNILIYVDGNEKNVTSYNYLVKTTVQGWVGPADAPEERLSKIVYFMTR